MAERKKSLPFLRTRKVDEIGRRAAVIVLATATMFMAACGGGARIVAGDGAPPFCEPVKKAYHALFNVENNDITTHQRAAHLAAQDFREAAKSAPRELADAVRGLADFYEEAAESSDDVGLRDIQDLLGHSQTLREAVKDQCGFTIDAAPR